MGEPRLKVFDTNLSEHHRLFPPSTSTSSSTRLAPVPLTQLMSQANGKDADDDMLDIREDSNSDDDGGLTRVSRSRASLNRLFSNPPAQQLLAERRQARQLKASAVPIMDAAQIEPTAEHEAPRVVYMDANTMEVLPTSIQSTTRRKRPKYTPGLSYRYSSPPTRLTHVHMVSMPEDRNDGYTTSSPAYIVEAQSTTQSPSLSTTPEEPRSRCPSSDKNRG